MHGCGVPDASVHRRRLLGLVYGLYGRFRGAIPIAFYVRVQSRAALKTQIGLCSSRAAPGRGLPNWSRTCAAVVPRRTVTRRLLTKQALCHSCAAHQAITHA